MEIIKAIQVKKGDIVSTPNTYRKGRPIEPDVKQRVTKVTESKSSYAKTGKLITLWYKWEGADGRINEGILIQLFGESNVGRHRPTIETVSALREKQK